MVRHILCQIFRFCAHGMTFAVAFSVLLAATWDGVAPCFACECYKCSDIVTRGCNAWFAWRESWDEYWWPMIWMGGAALAITIVPWTWHPSARTMELCVHAVNVTWLLMIIAPLPWRELQGKEERECGGLAFAFDYIGTTTGRLCGINFCLLLVSVGRSSAWLKIFRANYTEAISIHRAAGWWCVIHVVLHGLGFAACYYFEAGWEYMVHKLLPIDTAGRPNYRGLLNFYGEVGVLAGLILGAFAFQRVRRQMYGVFYSIHIISAVVFVFFGLLHDIAFQWYALAACSYIIERVHARCVRPTCMAQLERLSPTLVKLSLSLSCQQTLALGTRWLYVKVPCISREWHPFSITGPADATVLHIKTAGDWSKQLCSLAEERSEVEVFADGPYGIAERPWSICTSIGSGCCPFSSGDLAMGPLLLVAGGVGIVPFADLLDGEFKVWSNVLIIWAVRSENEYEILERSLGMRAKAVGRVQVQVYITQPARHATLAPESEIQARQAQVNQRHPHLESRFGLALKSQFVTGMTPGFVLFVAITMYGSISDWVEEQSWQNNIFKWSLATHGSLLTLTYVVVGLSAVLLALLVCAFSTATARARSCIADKFQRLQRDQVRVLLQDQQLMPAESHQFAIKEGRPDISAITCQFAQDWTKLSLRACGPSSLLDAVRVAVSKAKGTGRKVTLQIEQAEW